MAAVRDLDEKRALLFSTRLRFAPETQSIRDAAIDGVIEQTLLLIDPGTRLSIPQLEQIVRRQVGENPALGIADIRRAVTRLGQRGRVDGTGTGLDTRTYQLTETGRRDLDAVSRTAQSTYDKVLHSLFANAPGGKGRYAKAFLECLQVVFTNVAETYVRLITGDLDEGEIVEQKAIRSAIDQSARSHPEAEKSELERGLTTFLTETTPDYDSIKWNMTQNYYVLRALGWDSDGYLLSKTMFADAILYLDTNVVFPALAPLSRHHRNFEAVSKACGQLGISLRVTQLTINELRGVVTHARNLIEKVEGQIPEDLMARVNNVLYQTYLEARRQDPSIDLQSVFADFESAAKTLAESHDVELIDDLWFDDNRSSPDITKLAGDIRIEYSDRRPDREKSESASLHDALVLAWVEKERAREERPVWLVTLDTSLPGFVPDRSEEDRRPLAITLDALLQWIWPFAAASVGDGNLSQMFAEALKLHLLPRERFLDLRDFEVLADFRLACKELPAGDVEECIRLIQRKAPSLDLRSSEGREQLAYELARFFAAPGRRYKREVERLEDVLREQETQIATASEAHREEVDKLRAEFDAELRQVRDDVERRSREVDLGVRARDETITRLERQLEEEQAQRQADKGRHAAERLRTSARRRLAIAVAVWLILEVIVGWLVFRFDPRANTLKTLEAGWLWFVTVLTVSVLFTVVLLGRDRMKQLSWRTRQVLRHQDPTDS